MKRRLLLIFIYCLTITTTLGQVRGSKIKLPKGFQKIISFGANLPVGNFSNTHFWGIGVEFSISKYRYGQMAVKPEQAISFFYTLGIDYYFGKKETVSNYPYNYPGYTFINLYPGLIYNTDKKINISLTAGPALGIYNGTTQLNIGTTLSGTYYLNEKIGITPSLVLMKESGADPLLVVSLKGTWAF